MKSISTEAGEGNLEKSVRLFLADGTPDDLLTAEIIKWTAHVIAAPHSDLAKLLKRPETSRTGVYVLLGDDPNSIGGQLAYTDEGDDVGKRIYNHARSEDQRGKDFWEHIIATNLTRNSNHLKRSYTSLQQTLDANNSLRHPSADHIPEADHSDLE